MCSWGPPSFKGLNSYIHLQDTSTLNTISTDPLVVNVRFKVSSESGLLIYAMAGDSFLSVGLENGALILRFTGKDSGEEIRVVHNTTTVHDGLWHRLKAVR